MTFFSRVYIYLARDFVAGEVANVSEFVALLGDAAPEVATAEFACCQSPGKRQPLLRSCAWVVEKE